MGSECAKAYRECPIDHFRKRKHTVQDKCEFAASCAGAIEDATFPLLLRIFYTHREDKLRVMLRNLHYINDWFDDFNDKYCKLFFPDSILFRHNKVYTVTLTRYQHDCRALLSDIRRYATRVKPFVYSCKDVTVLNKYCRFAHTVAFYFRYLKKNNPPFFDNPPQHVRRIGLCNIEREYVDLERWRNYSANNQ